MNNAYTYDLIEAITYCLHIEYTNMYVYNSQHSYTYSSSPCQEESEQKSSDWHVMTSIHVHQPMQGPF